MRVVMIIGLLAVATTLAAAQVSSVRLPAETAGPGDLDHVTGANLAMGLGGLPVDVHLAALAGLLGFRTRLEEARDVEPRVESNAIHPV